MNETRPSQVILLDGRKLDFLIQPKLSSADLLDLVASHFNLKEKEYFGLAYNDITGHRCWLQPDKKVLDHEFTKKPGVLIFYFAVQFFIDNICYLRDTITVELFYLQAKQLIIKNDLETAGERLFESLSLILQSIVGDYTNDETTRANIKKYSLLSQKTIEHNVSQHYCEERMIYYYKKYVSMSRGQSIINLMTIIERLPNYGIHYYEVKDKSNISWYLGISFKGIALYDYNDRKSPRKIFPWRQLENLYYRERKFSIEVHETKSNQDMLNNSDFYLQQQQQQQQYHLQQQLQLLQPSSCSPSVRSVRLSSTSSANTTATTTADYYYYPNTTPTNPPILINYQSNMNSSHNNNTRRSQSVNSSLLSSTSHQSASNPCLTPTQAAAAAAGTATATPGGANQTNNQNQQNQVKVHAWFASVPSLCKSIWLMAVAQHQFYLDRKQSKSSMLQFKSSNDLANELNNTSNLTSSSSTNNVNELANGNAGLPRSNSLSSQELVEQSRLAKQEMWQLYKKRKENIENLLMKKKAELKDICVKEAEVTGKLPKEYPLDKGEELPQVKRKIGACYQFNKINAATQQQLHNEQIYAQLSLDYEIQSKITNAALILASDPSATKTIRKQRREFYEKARDKLTKIEKKLNAIKVHKYTQNNHSNQNSFLGDDMIELNVSVQNESKSTPTSPVLMHRKESYRRAQQQKLAVDKKSFEINASNNNQSTSITSKNHALITNLNIPLAIHNRTNQNITSQQQQQQSTNLNQQRKRLPPPPLITPTTSSSTTTATKPPQMQVPSSPLSATSVHSLPIQALNINNDTSYANSNNNVDSTDNFDQFSDNQNSYMNMLYGSTVNVFTAQSINDINIAAPSSLAKKRELSLNRYHSVDENTQKQTNTSNPPAIPSNTVSNNNNNVNKNEFFIRTSPTQRSLDRSNNVAIKPPTTTNPTQLLNHSPINILSSNITIRSSRYNNNGNNGNNNGITSSHHQHIPSCSSSTSTNSSSHQINNTSPSSLNNNNHLASTTTITQQNGLERNKQQNKKNTTSDSNVKLLADHNFYHVTNTNYHQNHQQNGNNSNNTKIISNKTVQNNNNNNNNSKANMLLTQKNEELFKNILFNTNTNTNNNEVTKPYELSDYYKYSSKHRTQQQTNNLLMINTNLTNNSNNEHSTPNQQQQQLQHQHQQQQRYQTANNLSTPTTIYDSLYVNRSNQNSPNVNINNNNNTNNNSTNTSINNNTNNTNSNSISLNLSIHTAEEFRKEMFAWFQNEHDNNNHLIHSGSTDNDSTSTTNSAQHTVTATAAVTTTAATLV